MLVPPSSIGQRAADVPEHDDEGQRGQHRGGQAGGEIDRRLGGDANIVGDPVFGVLMVAADQVELVVAAVADPAVEQMAAEPGTPAALRRHAGVDLGDRDADAGDQQREIEQRDEQHVRAVALLQGVEDRAIPDVHAVRGGEVQQHDRQQPAGQQPGALAAIPAPVARRAVPEPPQQRAASPLGGSSGLRSGEASSLRISSLWADASDGAAVHCWSRGFAIRLRELQQTAGTMSSMPRTPGCNKTRTSCPG